MKNIVVLTGSFNPVSKAHRMILEQVVSYVGADKGLFVLTNDAYLTKKLVVRHNDRNAFLLNEEVRINMLKSITKECPKLSFGCIELGNESPATSKTLKKLARENKGYRIQYLVGADKLYNIPRWSDVESILSTMDLIVVPRSDIDNDNIIASSEVLTKYKDHIIIIPKMDTITGISSTEIRRRFFNHEDYSELMDHGPYQIFSSFSPDDFKPYSDEDLIRMNIEFGGRFGGNAARKLVYKFNKNYYDTLNKKEIRDNTIVYSKEFTVESNTCYNTQTGVRNCDCADLALEMKKNRLNPAILNLASNKHPCGGYSDGTNAQEESLCYMSTLPCSLYQFGSPKYKCSREIGEVLTPNVYPMDINYGGIYSKNITFFRHNLDLYYALRDESFTCPIITVASLANDAYDKYSDTSESQYFDSNGYLTYQGRIIESNKIRTIYRIALDNHHDSLVLSAFGCGVYHLMPDEVSSLFKEILNEPEFKNKFKAVYFAILEGKGSSRKIVGRDGKFKPFYDDFGLL